MSKTNATSDDQWNEDSSQLFLEMNDIFVPGRVEQAQTLVGLIPAQQDEEFALVELAAGGGELAELILEHFPNCRYLALDRSPVMLAQLRQRLARFSERITVREFDIAAKNWRTQLPMQLRCVLSSLCVHHLSGEGKHELFSDMQSRLEAGGALLLADIIKPINQQSAELFALQYDSIVREQSLAAKSDLSGFERFKELKWNYFRHDYGSPNPDPLDQPSFLNEQLHWLSEVGFSVVDCYWMRAGHAVYGGYK